MASHNHDAVTSSINPNWRTPEWLLDALRREFTFVLDAAADISCPVAPHFLGPGSDLLTDGLCGVPWWSAVNDAYFGDQPTGAAIFCNPPYSQNEKMPIEPWVKQCAEEGMAGTVVGVLPFSPQTEWWRFYVQGHSEEDGTPHTHHKATEIRRFPYRIAFEPPPDYVGKAPGANVNTAVVVWRPAYSFVEPWAPQERYWGPPRPVRRQVGAGR